MCKAREGCNAWLPLWLLPYAPLSFPLLLPVTGIAWVHLSPYEVH